MCPVCSNACFVFVVVAALAAAPRVSRAQNFTFGVRVDFATDDGPRDRGRD